MISGEQAFGVMHMPRVHMCQQALCHAIIPFEQRYCDKHVELHKPFQSVTKKDKQQTDKYYNRFERDQEANAFYHSSSWVKVSNYVKNRDYYSDAITGAVIPDGELIVDHIVPRRYLSRDEALNTDNLWCLSRAHHNIKTKLEQSIESKPNGINKLKHMKQSWWQKAIEERIKKNE